MWFMHRGLVVMLLAACDQQSGFGFGDISADIRISTWSEAKPYTAITVTAEFWPRDLVSTSTPVTLSVYERLINMTGREVIDQDGVPRTQFVGTFEASSIFASEVPLELVMTRDGEVATVSTTVLAGFPIVKMTGTRAMPPVVVTWEPIRDDPMELSFDGGSGMPIEDTGIVTIGAVYVQRIGLSRFRLESPQEFAPNSTIRTEQARYFSLP
jgi:hypothetical protein